MSRARRGDACRDPETPGYQVIQLIDQNVYGTVNPAVAHPMRRYAHLDGLLVDPVYTARVAADLFARVADGPIGEGMRVVMIHTGGYLRSSRMNLASAALCFRKGSARL
jgi:1-aminocyclopropane-1-carboxylate deaminase/D-cysteine desulfhydrase-like pyridoxal-dependent ACC family enzyme